MGVNDVVSKTTPNAVLLISPALLEVITEAISFNQLLFTEGAHNLYVRTLVL